MSEQQLNSLDRFRKQPERLVLEQHSHCEVPAGCGGVVLRWRNPAAVRPFRLNWYSPAQAKFFLDGEPIKTGRPDLVPGEHILAILLEKADLQSGLLLFAARHDPKNTRRHPVPAENDLGVNFVSSPDGTWKFSLDPPEEAWATLSFDASDWPALEARDMPVLEERSRGRWQSEECLEQGAVGLGVAYPSRSTSNVWIRKLFSVPPVI